MHHEPHLIFFSSTPTEKQGYFTSFPGKHQNLLSVSIHFTYMEPRDQVIKKVTVTDDMSVITLEQSLSALIHYVLTTGT